MLPASPIEGIVIDFDGTLAGVTHVVSPRVKDAIARVKERIPVSICTGRPSSWVVDLAGELGLTASHIVEGGARVIDAQGRVRWEKLIPTASLQRLITLAQGNGFFIIAQYDGSDYVRWVPGEGGVIPFMTHILLCDYHRARVEEILAQVQKDFPDVHAVLSYYDDDDESAVWLVDVTAQGANKQHALLHLAEREGLNLKQFMAIGDGYNDFPLLMACGFRVAMGNAAPELKAIADYVAPSVDEDGVADAIERFVLHA